MIKNRIKKRNDLYKPKIFQIIFDPSCCVIISPFIRLVFLNLKDLHYLNWVKGKAVGNIPVLSDPDIDALKEYIFDNAIEKAEELRKERFGNARLFLIRCNCLKS